MMQMGILQEQERAITIRQKQQETTCRK